jgi:hypothetical protein
MIGVLSELFIRKQVLSTPYDLTSIVSTQTKNVSSFIIGGNFWSIDFKDGFKGFIGGYYASTLEGITAFELTCEYDISGVLILPTPTPTPTNTVTPTITPTNTQTPTPTNIPTTQTVTACDSYTWPVNGVTYNSSGTYTSGIYTLILTINNSTSSSQSETAIGSYTWPVNGVTYTTSGTYVFVGTNSAGCPDTYILFLTIN